MFVVRRMCQKTTRAWLDRRRRWNGGGDVRGDIDRQILSTPPAEQTFSLQIIIVMIVYLMWSSCRVHHNVAVKWGRGLQLEEEEEEEEYLV